MNEGERARFDELVSEALENVPARLIELLEEQPLIVEDRPAPDLLEELGMGPDDVLCGLHSGVPITERSVEDPSRLPDEIVIYREGIVAHAGGWAGDGLEDRVYEEIWVTILHEIGHHFGLDEDELAELGFD